MWRWHEGVVNILRKYQHIDVAVFSEQVVPYDDKIIRQLTNILGQQRRVECSQWGGATRTRDFYLLPEINISPIPTKAARTYNLRDGWRWPIPKLQHLTNPPPTLRAIYPELLRRAVHNEITWNENDMLKQLQIHHAQTNQTHHAGPSAIAMWLGIPDNIIDDLQKSYECEGAIDDAAALKTLQMTNNNSIIVHEHINICGAVRLCTTCAKLSQLLGKCWHLPAASAWLEALIWHTIRRPPEPATIDKYSSLDEVHKCNSTCKHVEYTKNHWYNN